MFLATALLYPCVLAGLCGGAGLLVDRRCGGFVPASLLLPVGAAGLIALSQLSAYVHVLAPATPYLLVVVALAGFALGRDRARAVVGAAMAERWLAPACMLAYLFALAPVLLAGRPSFSSYMTLADSAVHMLGADFLLHHGQDYAHLELRNSYGQFVNDYYNSSYPSGADTLFGASAFLLGLPLIWAYQPFNAFILASAVGPAWWLARRTGLERRWAALAAVTAVLPALVYAYALFGSIKELTALSMILTLACLAVAHRSWLGCAARRAVPFALVLAAGVSALGVAFGAWALVPVIALACVLFRRLRAGALHVREALTLLGASALTVLIAAWPTWARASAAFTIASDIANTANPGNLQAPLRTSQVLGVWLRGSYKLAPSGAALTLTHALLWLTLLAAVGGGVQLLRARSFVFAGWVAGMLVAWLVVGHVVTTWASAKTLVLTSPAVLLLAWAGVAALRLRAAALDRAAAKRATSKRQRSRAAGKARASRVARRCAVLLALAIAGGVLVSDVLQYHSSNLAPTARYDELASINSRFAGRGPTLFTDFDEYALYELRDMDVGGPSFAYPPSALARIAGGYGRPASLDRASATALLAYPLIVTRRDPLASRPPAAYRLLWQGSYYQVWGRRPHAPPASVHLVLSGSRARQCARIGRLARGIHGTGRRLLAAPAPTSVGISLRRATRPVGWGRAHDGLAMRTPGTLSARFHLPTGGQWNVWVQGQIMPRVTLSVDGRKIASIAGQLDGNSLVANTVPPVSTRLAAGGHSIELARDGFSLAPGNGGSAVLRAIFLTPAHADPQGPLRESTPARWSSLCGHRYRWVEVVRA